MFALLHLRGVVLLTVDSGIFRWRGIDMAFVEYHGDVCVNLYKDTELPVNNVSAI